jgi:beta-glucosidase-like glycosyl hydrolase
MRCLLALATSATVALAAPADPKAAAAEMIKKMTLEEKVTLLHGGKNPGQAGYVGNTPSIERLGIPALNLNDGPQGFRSGGTTCWPSGLTVATTWDMQTMGAWGEAMGGEFFGKGSNVQLGPGVCVARVPNWCERSQRVRWIDWAVRAGIATLLTPPVHRCASPQRPQFRVPVGRVSVFLPAVRRTHLPLPSSWLIMWTSTLDRSLNRRDPYLGYELVQPVISGIQSKGVIANAKHFVNNNQETDRSGGNEVVDERTRWEVSAERA